MRWQCHMNEPAPALAAEINAIREAYAALNRGDVLGFVSAFDPQIERIELFDFPAGSAYHGLEAVTQHISTGRATWAEGGCEPRRFIVAGNRVIVLIDVRVRLKNETQWRESRIADVYTFRNGKAIEFRTFGDERQAMDWAGVEASGQTVHTT